MWQWEVETKNQTQRKERRKMWQSKTEGKWWEGILSSIYIYLSISLSLSTTCTLAITPQIHRRHYPLFNSQLMPTGLSCLTEDGNEDMWRGKSFSSGWKPIEEREGKLENMQKHQDSILTVCFCMFVLAGLYEKEQRGSKRTNGCWWSGRMKMSTNQAWNRTHS